MTLKAFTIVELMMAAIVSAITVAAAVSAFEIIDRQFHHFRVENEAALALTQFYTLMQQDFEQAEYIEVKAENILCHGPKHTIFYQLEAQSVQRGVQQADYRIEPFPYRLSDLTFKLRGQARQSGLIDCANFQIVLADGRVKHFSLAKHYSSADLFEHYGD